jgi:hypothetical protein
VQWVARRATRWQHGPAIVMMLGLGFVTVIDTVMSVRFILEQQGIGRDLKRKTFLAAYRKGKMQPVVTLAQGVARHVPAGGRVLGPEPRIMTYLSGRPVFHSSEVLAHKKRHEWKNLIRRRDLTWCAYGPAFPEEKRLNELIRRHYIIVQPVADAALGDRLKVAKLIMPEPKRKRNRRLLLGPRATTRATTRPATRAATRPATTRPAKTRPANTRPAKKKKATQPAAAMMLMTPSGVCLELPEGFFLPLEGRGVGLGRGG